MMEHGLEPVVGLPGPLPKGERILWQGRPDWRALALRAYHVRGVAIYFLLLIVWRLWVAVEEGDALAEMGQALMPLVILGVGAIAILTLLGWLSARAAIFTITNRRIVIRCGVAIDMAINVPFSMIGSAAMKVHGDGTGDLPVAVQGDQRVSYILLWPFVRPWRMGRPEPMLRAVPDGAQVGEILAAALKAAREVTVEAGQPTAANGENVMPTAARAPVSARSPHLAPAMGSVGA